jgi:hypothetical protein
MTNFRPNFEGISLLLTNPKGGIARELERVGDRVVVETKINLGRQAPNYFRSAFGGTLRNPPPGPPHRRSGDLQSSVRREDARIEQGTLVVECVAPAVHRGWYYDQELRRRGYKFVDLGQI